MVVLAAVLFNVYVYLTCLVVLCTTIKVSIHVLEESVYIHNLCYAADHFACIVYVHKCNVFKWVFGEEDIIENRQKLTIKLYVHRVEI